MWGKFRTNRSPERSVGVGTVEAVRIQVEGSEGEGPRKIDLANPAPFGYSIAFTLGLVALIDRADSAMVGGLLPTLQEYFGFGDTAAGILLSAPSVAALLLVVPAGRLADTRSRKMVLSVVILTWGLLTFGAAAAPTFILFFVARVLLGVATPLNIPASASIVGDAYRTEARTKAFAIVRVMEYLGFPLGVLIGGVVGATLGWRSAFLVAAVPAVLLSAYIALRFREPKRGLADELSIQVERAGLPLAVAEPDEHVGVVLSPEGGVPANRAPAEDADFNTLGVLQRTKNVLGIRTLRWVIIGQMLLFAGFTGLFSFAPTFFYRVHDLNEATAAALSGGLGLLGLLAGGALASRIGDRHHGTRRGWRILVSGVALTFAAFAVLVFAAVPNLLLQIVLFQAIGFCNIIALANLGAVQADVIPARIRGTGFATAQFLITIGGSMGAVIVGTVSGYFIRRETTVTQGEVNDASEALDDAKEAVADAVAADAPSAVVDGLQATADQAQTVFDQIDAIFGPAQALGIRWGVAALFIVLFTGAITIFGARASYDDDAAAVLADVDASEDRSA